MTEPLTPNTQAILLLTAPLLVGRGEPSRDLLSLGEYKRLARLLREERKQPADLIEADAQGLLGLCSRHFERARLEALLGRGFLLSQAVERWNSRAIWVISRADAAYPRRLKAKLKEDAPPLLYGCGHLALLEKGGLAVVGSRHIDEELVGYTEKLGRLCAEAQRPVVSGGAKGIDQAAMRGALAGGGRVAGVMADSLERAALARENREAFMEGRLVLISPYDPSAGFNVGHAMQRNKLIYALADAALVVAADFQKGGTWTGAIEQLESLHFVPVFARTGDPVGKGNAALLQKGAQPWPDPLTSEELNATLRGASVAIPAQPQQETLSWAVGEGSLPSSPQAEVRPVVPESNPPGVSLCVSEGNPTPAETLLGCVRQIVMQQLVDGATKDEVAGLLGVSKPQAKAWLTKLAGEGVLEKIKKSKTVRYRAVSRRDRLF